jgi:hypothetical protein
MKIVYQSIDILAKGIGLKSDLFAILEQDAC